MKNEGREEVSAEEVETTKSKYKGNSRLKGKKKEIEIVRNESASLWIFKYRCGSEVPAALGGSFIRYMDAENHLKSHYNKG